MIKKIKYIKEFGVFKDFTWSSTTSDFKNFNLIYAWNYSGKTTLSRILRSFETQEIHEDFLKSSYELELYDGSSARSDALLNNSLSVRVYNSDYINTHLSWDNSNSIEPIFILGEENIELQKQLDLLRKEVVDLKQKYQLSHTVHEKLFNSFDKSVRNRAQSMKKELQLLDYNKTKLENGINTIKEIYSSHILSDEAYQDHLRIAIDSNKKDIIREVGIPELHIETLQTIVNEIMERKIVANVIKRLEENPTLNDWVRMGRELHKTEDTCQFCGRLLPDDLMDKLEHHFTDDFELLFRDINKTEKDILNQIEVLDEVKFPHPTEFYNDLQQSVHDSKNKLDIVMEGIREQLDSLTFPLKYKRMNPFQTGNYETEYAAATSFDVTTPTEELRNVLIDLNKIVKEHNRRSTEFENVKRSSKEKIKNHHISQFIDEFEYFNKLTEINNAATAKSNLEIQINELQQQIKAIETQLLDATKGAEKVNEYLNIFFRSNRLKIDVHENRFILKRNGKVARNLSEGEKSAISFIYFITQLEDRDTNLQETVVAIDDPISSLDQNHIHSVFAIIKAKLNPLSCNQIIISTHNSEFFNLMKDLAISDIPRYYGKNDKQHDQFVSFYFIERKFSDDEIISSIVPLPQELKNYKSEYVFLFALLKKFNSNPTLDVGFRAIIPNVARRFLEAYLNFRNPGKQGLIQKMNMLFTEDTDRFLVFKFTNEYSHNDQINHRTFYLPDLQECVEVVTLIFKCLEEKDKIHYDALVDNIN